MDGGEAEAAVEGEGIGIKWWPPEIRSVAEGSGGGEHRLRLEMSSIPLESKSLGTRRKTHHGWGPHGDTRDTHEEEDARRSVLRLFHSVFL